MRDRDRIEKKYIYRRKEKINIYISRIHLIFVLFIWRRFNQRFELNIIACKQITSSVINICNWGLLCCSGLRRIRVVLDLFGDVLNTCVACEYGEVVRVDHGVQIVAQLFVYVVRTVGDAFGRCRRRCCCCGRGCFSTTFRLGLSLRFFLETHKNRLDRILIKSNY